MKYSRIIILILAGTLCRFGHFSRFDLRAEEENPSPPTAQETDPSTSEEKAEPEAEKTPEPIDPVKSLQRILGGMKLSAELIRKAEAAVATKTTQPQVVKDLDELIEFLESQSGSSPPPPPDASQQPMDREEPMPGQQPQPNPQNSGEPDRKNDPSKSPEEARSQESTERKQPPPVPGERKSLSGQQLYEKEVWGHLPPALRRELMNVYSEKYIPQYEDLVRRYYESLAEGNRRRNSSR